MIKEQIINYLDRISDNFDKEIKLPILNQDMLYVLKFRSVVCLFRLNDSSKGKNSLESLFNDSPT
jgi:hypothetical protein